MGGGIYPQPAMERFIEWSGGEKARLLAVPWGGEGDDPKGYCDSFERAVHKIKQVPVTCSVFAEHLGADVDTFLKQLGNATGVFFTGGDQNSIFDILEKHPDLTEKIRKVYLAGIPFAGKSAGTAIMSPKALTGKGDFSKVGKGLVETRAGLGLLPGTIVDQHFLARLRLYRLMSALLDETRGSLGIGVEENSALAIENNRFGEVLGNSPILFLRHSKNLDFLTVPINPGEKIDLEEVRNR